MSDFYCETPDSGEPPCAGLAALRAEVAGLKARIENQVGWVQKYQDEAHELREQVERLGEALTELVAMVRGECPSLLDEDSGGSANLAIKIDAALAQAQKEGA